MDLCPARVCWQSAGEARQDAEWRVGVMVRLKNRKQAAVWTKAGPGNLCSSLLGCSLPRKKKRDLTVVIFCSDMTLWGSYPRCPSQKSPALNATGRLSSLQQKTFAPALWGIPVPGINPRPGVPRFASIHAGPRVFFVCVSAPSSVHFVPITSGRDICKICKNRASKVALFNG